MMIPRDKLLHFGVCLIASIMSPFLAAGLAIGKEWGDREAASNHWCWWDLLADALGILVGGAVHILILRTIV